MTFVLQCNPRIIQEADAPFPKTQENLLRIGDVLLDVPLHLLDQAVMGM